MTKRSSEEMDEQGQDHDFLSDPEEKRVFFAALDSFRQYSRTAHLNVTHRRRQNLYAMPTAHWRMLSEPPFNILNNLERVDDAIDANADIAGLIWKTAVDKFGYPGLSVLDWQGTATSSDLDKARSTLRQLYRDWSLEGAEERHSCYAPVLQDIAKAFANIQDKRQVKLLVPGAGLGRLIVELCQAGYDVEGNEISYHQIMASNWILNGIPKGQTFDLYPFAAEFSNVISREHQLRLVQIPDAHPTELLERNEHDLPVGYMNMTMADFVVLYAEDRYRNTFDAVITVFFIDTAPNIIKYIEVIQHCLKDGGFWINLGPLLWHFADRGPADHQESKQQDKEKQNIGIGEAGSVELSEEEVLILVEKMGFAISEHEIRNDGIGYIQNRASMLQNTYRNSHWVAMKKAVTQA